MFAHSLLFIFPALIFAQPLYWQCPDGSDRTKNYAENPVFSIDSLQTLRFHSTRPTVQMRIFQEVEGQGGQNRYPITTLQNVNLNHEYNWTVKAPELKSITSPIVVYLELDSGENEPDRQVVTSQYLTLTNEKVEGGGKCAAGSTKSTASTSVPSPPPASFNGPSSSKGISAGATAGISIGCVIAGLVGGLGVGWLIWRRKQSKSVHATPADVHHTTGQPPVQNTYQHNAEQWGQAELGTGAEWQHNTRKEGRSAELPATRN